jgi:hypothetical protein
MIAIMQTALIVLLRKMIGQRARHECETGTMVPPNMIDMTTF